MAAKFSCFETMQLSEETDDSSVTQSNFLWDRWPTDDRGGDLPMMNSVLWPFGEQCKGKSLTFYYSFFCNSSLAGVGFMSLWIECRFLRYVQNFTNPRREDRNFKHDDHTFLAMVYSF